MSKGGSSKVYDFYYSIAMAVCRGPIDSFNYIKMKDKVAAWVPITTDTDTLLLDEGKLFGGDKGEGGPRGYVDYRMGGNTQLMSEVHASKHDDLPENLPGYRGLAYLFFHGRGGGTIGFRWTTNSAYFPEIFVGVSRLPKLATIPDQIWPIVGVDEAGDYIIAGPGDAYSGDEKVRPAYLPDANPASIIYEALTEDWGLQELESSVDIGSFQAAAQTLLDEHFGLSMIFTRQMEVEAFIGEVLDHIRAVLFIHPSTGLWVLKLIRDDYELGDCPILDPSNCKLERLKTRTWDNTINEIIVSYTDPHNEESETVSAINNANVTIQGGVKSEERDYFGVRNPWLALELAQRDVDESSRTLKSIRVSISRGVSGILPGSVVRLDWPEENISELYCRVQAFERGTSSDRTVVVEMVEDIFAAKRAVRGVQEPVLPTQPEPVALDYEFVFSPPASIVQSVGLGASEFPAIYPETAVAFIAGSSTYIPTEIDILGTTVLGNGSTASATLATFFADSRSTLGTTLTPEARSTIPVANVEAAFGEEPAPGAILAIGATEEVHELVMLDSTDGTNWTVIRALFDTLPLTWADSTVPLWPIEITDDNFDTGSPVAGVEESYKFLPTSNGTTLAEADATAYLYTPMGRAAAPYRPANCQIDGNGFGVADYSAEPSVPTTVPITWANRNRMAEDSVALAWDDASVTPEVGQTTILRFRSGAGVVFEATGLEGSSYDLDPSNLPPVNNFTVEFVSVRDGIECVYPATRELILPNGGGWDYGWDQGWDQ